MSDKDLCVHGADINGDCDGVCEHGAKCGSECSKCAKDYATDLRRLMNAAGGGNTEHGREILIGILTMMEEEADRDEQ